MPNVLDYKGLRSTRVLLLAVAWIAATALLVTGKLTGDQWLDLTKWGFGLYAVSEAGAKGASALAATKGAVT